MRQGYLIIETPTDEEDISSIKQLIEDDEDCDDVTIEEQGNKLVLCIKYDDIEEVAQIASNIIYNCISTGIYNTHINYCGKETNTYTNRNTKGAYSSISSNNSRSPSFDSYIRSSLTI